MRLGLDARKAPFILLINMMGTPGCRVLMHLIPKLFDGVKYALIYPNQSDRDLESIKKCLEDCN